MIVRGIAASKGIAIAKAYLLRVPDLSFDKIAIHNPEVEIERFQRALEASKRELHRLKLHTKRSIDATHAEIFTAQMLILNDPELINPVIDKIKTEQINTEAALHEVSQNFIRIFENMNNEHIRERAADIKDVTKRIMKALLGKQFPSLPHVNEDIIIIAHDITPSYTSQLDRQFIKGIITEIGGQTSHSAIMARSLEIPSMVVKGITDHVDSQEMVIIDAEEGKVIIDPSENELKKYKEKQLALSARKKGLLLMKDMPTFTTDGEQVTLAGNINHPHDVHNVLDHGGEGIGLYRTEFLYLDKDEPPTEDDHYEAYRYVLEQMNEKPVVIRTLDAGGDKDIHSIPIPFGDNPFLGQRAIRYCLDHEHIFRPQLRALLRASIHGILKIVFPMIATIEEFRQAKAILIDEKNKLLKERIPISDNIEVGIMVEIPSTALIAKQFAKEADFFSIGTNDLIQYTMAADRMNEQVNHLYQPFHPAIIHLINQVIEAAQQEGRWVSMCGEMAGDNDAIPILIALGLDEFSMNPSSILPARDQIGRLSYKKLSSHKKSLLDMISHEEVYDYVQRKLKT